MEKCIKRILSVIGIASILGACILLSKDIYQQQKLEQIEEQQIEQFLEMDKKTNVEEDIQVREDTKREEVYIAVLEIPKIHFKKGLYDINSSKNNVDETVQILKESDFPNIESGNMILAGHSGIGKSAYFNQLNTLQKGDLIFLYYQGIKYVYQFSNCYEIEKTGYFEVPKNDETTLILITCKMNTNMQLVFISKLIHQKTI